MNENVDWTPPVAGFYGSSFRLGEWISGPVTPFFEDWALTRMEAVMHGTLKRYTGQPAPLPHHVVINGWYFYSLAWLPVTARALLRWAPSLISHLVRHPRRLAPVIPPTAKYGIRIYEREWQEEVRPRYVADVAAGARRAEDEDPGDLVRLVDEMLELAGEYFAWVMVVGGAAYKAEARLVGFYHKQLAPTIGGTHLTLLIGLESPTEAAAHAVDTLDWASPTLGERGLVGGPRTAGVGAALRERREAAEREARSALAGSPRKLRTFDERLAEAQRLGPIREEQMAEFTLPWPVMRRALGRIGQRLVELGVIALVEDVYYLRRDELESALADEPAAELGSLVAERRAAVSDAAALSPPRYVGDVPRLVPKFLDMAAKQMGVEKGVADALTGIPVSPGSATGVARIIRGPDGFDRLAPGDVLVAPITAPAWTPLFARASGVVTDGGNLFSHASVVAREFGIPAVVGCVDATRRLVDGQTVTIDGSHGTVSPATSRQPSVPVYELARHAGDDAPDGPGDPVVTQGG